MSLFKNLKLLQNIVLLSVFQGGHVCICLEVVGKIGNVAEVEYIAYIAYGKGCIVQIKFDGLYLLFIDIFSKSFSNFLSKGRGQVVWMKVYIAGKLFQ
jgi:hypothetical protein